MLCAAMCDDNFKDDGNDEENVEWMCKSRKE